MANTVKYDPNLTQIDVARRQTEQSTERKKLIRIYSDMHFELGSQLVSNWHTLSEEERKFLGSRRDEVANILAKLTS